VGEQESGIGGRNGGEKDDIDFEFFGDVHERWPQLGARYTASRYLCKSMAEAGWVALL
jgi:hypothetical protein